MACSESGIVRTGSERRRIEGYEWEEVKDSRVMGAVCEGGILESNSLEASSVWGVA